MVDHELEDLHGRRDTQRAFGPGAGYSIEYQCDHDGTRVKTL